MSRLPTGRFAGLIPLVALVGIAACTGGALSQKAAQQVTVAEVNGGPLKGAALERWMLKDDSLPGPAVANTLVSTWINTALMIADLRAGRTLDDSATIDAVILPDAERGVTQQFFVARDRARPVITDAQADSLADVDRVRVFQDILTRMAPNADSAAVDAVRNRVLALEKTARSGHDFAALARESSEDSASRLNGGMLPAVSRDDLERLPPRMRNIWILRPGDISDPILSGLGAHIVRRVTREQARPALKAWLGPILARRADSLFIDSLVDARHVVISPDSRPRVRALAREPVTVSDSEPFAIWQGGTLTPAMVRSSILMLDPRARTGLSNGSDSLISAFLHGLAAQRVVLGFVIKGPMPPAEARNALKPSYLRVLGFMRDQFNRLPATVSPADAATMFMDSVLAGKQRYVPLPGALGEMVRDGANIKVDTTAVVGVYRASIPAWQAAHANDTTRSSRPAPAPGVTPAAPPPQ